MRIAVIDVGANTMRLLVVEPTRAGFRSCHERKVRLSLGMDIEATGSVSRSRIDEAADSVRAFAGIARRLGAVHLDLLVTSPGRQARNGAELANALTRAARVPAQILSSEAEGMLAYRGAMAGVWPLPEGNALVCDVGGGSTQLVVGFEDRIVWQASLDVGSLRLTQRHRLAKPNDERIAAARGELQGMLATLDVPGVECGCATGGSASALGRLCERELDGKRIEATVRALGRSSPAEISRKHGIGRWRSERLLGGALILQAVQARVGVPLRPARGGIREGAVLLMLGRAAA
jgi:exopolyphosphatase/guanosine-5'-triphosphate,3'-diphosphate pyrophosphatase